MGVPCVSMAGLVHAHNVGVTLLHQVGKCQTSILDLIISKVRGADNPFAPFVTQSSDVFVHMYPFEECWDKTDVQAYPISKFFLNCKETYNYCWHSRFGATCGKD